MELLLIAVAVVAGLAVVIWLIALAFGALDFTFKGAAVLSVCAAEQGFIGLAVYAACWVFLFPVMLIVSLALGVIMVKWGEMADEAKQQSRIADMERRKQELHLRGEASD